MKVSMLMPSVYPVLLVLFSSIFSTSFQTSNTPSGKEGCTISVQKAVRFGFKRKQVDGRAFPKEADIDNTSILDEMAPGNLEVCVDATGNCNWLFVAKARGQEDLAIEVAGMEDVVSTMLMPKGRNSPDIAGFLLAAKEKGAIIEELGNGTVSVTMKNDAINRTTISLVDTRAGNLLGSSVYRVGDGALLAKLVCMGKPGNALSMSMFVFEHKMGEHTGWVTEIICEIGR